jgi:hypothetical protein
MLPSRRNATLGLLLASATVLAAWIDPRQLLAIFLLSLLGVTPASDFGQTGNVRFTYFDPDASASSGKAFDLGSLLQVDVQNDDGTYSACDYRGTDGQQASPYNSLAVLIDDSGSMERNYPVEEFGDVCPTCPHDPGRQRVEATRALIDRIRDVAPQSRFGVFDFGPATTEGLTATQVLLDFTAQADGLEAALERVDGSQEAGTPLWDSIIDVVGMVGTDADAYEVLLQQAAADGSGGATDPDVKRYILVISDGQDTLSTATIDDAIAAARDTDVVVHAVGLGEASARRALAQASTGGLRQEQQGAIQGLQSIAEATGGFYASVDDPSELRELFENIANGLAQGYATDTFTCVPAEGSGVSGTIPDSGNTVAGQVRLANAFALPWTIVAP